MGSEEEEPRAGRRRSRPGFLPVIIYNFLQNVLHFLIYFPAFLSDSLEVCPHFVDLHFGHIDSVKFILI